MNQSDKALLWGLLLVILGNQVEGWVAGLHYTIAMLWFVLYFVISFDPLGRNK